MAKVLQRLDILLFANTAQYRSEMRDTQQSTTTMMGAIKADAANMAKVGAAAFAGMAAAGTAAIGVMIKEQIALEAEITALAKVANTSTQEWQKLALAAKDVGIESETLGDIYKDTQDKIGDFLSTGGGGMADFFENIAPQIGVTAEEFRNLSGPDALQKYYNGLQQANLGQSELIFYMESVASDAATLIPLLHDNGEGMRMWGEAAENAGIIMSDKTVTASQDLRAANDLMMLSMDGAKQQFTSAFIPVLADVANKLVGSGDAADIARKAGDFLVKTFKVVAQTGNVVITVFKTVGTVVGGAAATVMTLLDGVSLTDGLFTTAVKIAGNGRAAADVVRNIGYDTKVMWQEVRANNAVIEALGTGTSNAYVDARKKQNELKDEIERQQGLTGQQYQAKQAAADAAAKASEKSSNAAIKAAEKEAKAQKDLGAAYVSNAALSGLKLKANEAIAGGKVRGYTADFAEVTQSLLGSNLKYFSALNDTYHAGSNSKHASGQAFDVVLKDANQAASAASIIEQAAKKYGYNVKILNEYAKPSKNATGGHLHVSVYGQKATKDGGPDLQFMRQQDNEANKLADDQTRIAEQQAQQRTAIRMEYANEVVRIEMQLANQIDKINASGFNEDERKAFISDAKQRAAIDIANYQDTQTKKLAAFSDFTRSERDIVTQNAIDRATAVLRDPELSPAARTEALGFIKQKAVYELNQIDLVHDQEMQYAQQINQTETERITNQYALERREIQLTVNMDEQLRKAKIDAINQAEQIALDERRYAFESELRQLNSIGQSDLAALRQSYADQRRELDQRTDINPAQKSDLRNAMAGAQIYDTNQLQKGARDGFNAQQADMNGTGANYAIALQYQARLDVIQDAVKAEVLAVEQAEQAKYAARLEFETASTQLTLSSAEQTVASLAGSFKTMLGEQNIAYKLLFAGQQTFVVASAGLNMYEAWGDAMAEGATLSQKIAGAATIATEFGRIISAASSMTLELPGYQTGGYTGAGGLSDVAGLVHKEEFVANAPTTKRFRPELEAMHNGTYERQSSAPNVNVTVTVSMDGNSSVESNSQYGKQLGQGLAAVVVSEVNKMTRPNGALDRLYAKR